MALKSKCIKTGKELYTRVFMQPTKPRAKTRAIQFELTREHEKAQIFNRLLTIQARRRDKLNCAGFGFELLHYTFV